MLPLLDAVTDLTASVDPDNGDCWITGYSPAGFFSVVKSKGVWDLEGNVPSADALKDFFERVSDKEAKILFQEASKAFQIEEDG